MDQIKTGRFIAELRKEQHITQEKLGEKIGVTNKTISRWENGVYMPDIEMLQILSREFNVSINEIIAGKRIPPERLQEQTEENIVEVLKKSSFSLDDKIKYYKGKWLKEHVSIIVFSILVLAAVLVCSIIKKWPLAAGLTPIFALGVYIWLRNRMMIYVEKHVYEDR